MIKTRKEYDNMVAQLEREKETLTLQKQRLVDSGLDERQVEIAMEPLLSFHDQLKDEIETYDQIVAGKFERFDSFNNIGRLLIALRIHRGLTQRELSIRLGKSESQVSRDESDEYHGASLVKVREVLDALEFTLHNRVEPKPEKHMVLPI